MEPTRVDIIEGQIILDYCSVLIDLPEIKLLEVDSASKYAEIEAYGFEDETKAIEVFLGAGEHTLDSIKSDKYTTVRIYFDRGNFEAWTCIAEVSKYTIFIALFPLIEGKVLWMNEKENKS